MMSMSVTNTAPSGLAPTPIIAKFFRISQPIAPAPTCEGVIVCGCVGVIVCGCDADKLRSADVFVRV